MADFNHLIPRVDQSDDSNIGSSQDAPNSVSSVISTLVPVLVVAVVWMSLFLVFRVKFPRNYHPRTFLGSLRPHDRSPSLPNGLFNWIGEFYNIPDSYVLTHHSIDGYLFLRLLKISVVCCFVGCCITWPILFPINATGGGGQKQFDILTFGNVTNNYYKMFAHAGCAIIFFCFLLYMITRESIYFINLRQAFLISRYNASRISSRTVLYTSIPENYMDEKKLKRMLEPGVRRVWLACDAKELEELVGDRDKAAMKLEGAETAIIKLANGNRLKQEKSKGGRTPSQEEALPDAEQGAVASAWVPAKKRPTHRLKPLIGKKVDTIDWCRNELSELIPKIEGMQADQKAGKGVKKLNSAFVEYETLSEAQAAYQSLTHHHVLQMSPRFIGMTPSEVIWSNLNIKWWERVIRKVVTISAVVTLIIFWSIPVAFIGAISNVNHLIELLPFLSFLNSLPHWLMGVVTGLLPTILLAVLMALLPIFLRLMAKVGGDPTTSAVELTVQNSYFAFQVVQVFLVATLGSAATSVVQSVSKDPSSAPGLLAQNIPKASNFYLSYFVLQGFGVVSGVLVGLVGFILFIVLGKFLDKTPRKMYMRWISLGGIGWGTLFPIYTNLFVIAICYAAIAPLVLGFATIGLYFFYFAYRYNMLYIVNSNIDCKGRTYPRALQHLFVGIYVAEVCLIGLFAIATGQSVGALGPLILMIIMLIFTALFHINFNSALQPLLTALPKSLDAEERRLHAIENGEDPDDAESSLYDEKVVSSSPDSGAPAATSGKSSGNPISKEKSAESRTNTKSSDLTGPPHKKPNMFQKWLRPDIYTDYATMRRLVPNFPPIEYTAAEEDNAYYHPAVISGTQMLWIPKDPLGISKTEVRDTSKSIPITDEGAYLDEKNNVVWDAQDGRPPIYEEPVYY
ncbi:DUF221-domain-containing protein [Polychaeton citri CBS 116435]|uniref:DUF221-domain-containing protein n=1 Tax=Polychaeton citri CBS 116435 TaxID=1314669 RepID=A0A9P4Q5Y5_9PEZI|nr:DUF221-domain-containing protein [Polychaeton citri CBS 116435]